MDFKVIPSDFLKFNKINNIYRTSILIKNSSNFDLFIHLEKYNFIINGNHSRIERNSFKRLIIEGKKENIIKNNKIKVYIKYIKPDNIFMKYMEQNLEDVDNYDVLLIYNFKISNDNNKINPLEIIKLNNFSVIKNKIKNNIDKSINCNLIEENTLNLDLSNIDKFVNNKSFLSSIDIDTSYNNIQNRVLNSKLITEEKSKTLEDFFQNNNNSYDSKININNFNNNSDYNKLANFLENKNKSKLISEEEFENKFKSLNKTIVKNNINDIKKEQNNERILIITITIFLFIIIYFKFIIN